MTACPKVAGGHVQTVKMVDDHIWDGIGPGQHLLLRICTVHGFNVDATARLCCATGEQPEWRPLCPIMFALPLGLRRLILNP